MVLLVTIGELLSFILLKIVFTLIEIVVGRVALVLIVLIGVGLVFDGLRDAVTYVRHVRPLDRRAVGDVNRTGLCQIAGTVSSHERTLTAPISRKECVAYECEVSERAPRGGTSSACSGVVAVPFEVSDGTGTALVEPDDADFRLDGALRHRVKRGGEVPDRIRSLADPAVRERLSPEFDIASEKFESSSYYKRTYTERRIEPGDEVCVVGEASMDSDAWTGPRIEVGPSAGTPYLVIEGAREDVSGLFLDDVLTNIAVGVVILVAFYWFFSPPSTFVEYLFSTPMFWR